VKAHDKDGKNVKWKDFSDENRGNFVTQDGWVVDILSVDCPDKGKPCSVFYHEHAPPGTTGGQFGGKSGATVKDAAIIDKPQGVVTKRFWFEVCAFCLPRDPNEDPNAIAPANIAFNNPQDDTVLVLTGKAQALGCVTWGFDIADNGDPIRDEITANDTASAAYKKALDAFAAYFFKK